MRSAACSGGWSIRQGSLAEQQDDREGLKRQLDQEVQECTEVRIEERNHVKKFLMEYGVWHLSEIDYPLRLIYEDYVKKYKIPYRATLSCLHTFDKMKFHAMRQEMQTISGRRKYELKFTDQVVFLPYYPKPEIAAQFVRARDKNSLVWDFTKKCSRKILFLQADRIHWHAQIWYLERFHFSKERINSSKIVESISFREITQEANQKYLKEYMRYALGITDMSLSSIRSKFLDIRKSLQAFDREEKNICELQEEKIRMYLETLRKKELGEKIYKLMEVYIEKYQIQPGEYLFQDHRGFRKAIAPDVLTRTRRESNGNLKKQSAGFRD